MSAITVTITSTTFPSYATQTTADAYLLADIERFDAWSALTPDQKGRALASATRLLRRLKWAAGAAPDTDTTTVTQPVADACCLLAGDIASDPSKYTTPGTDSNVKSVGAGPAKVEFFRPVVGTPLPVPVWDLLKELLGYGEGLDGSAWGYAGGTDVDSAFSEDGFAPGFSYQ